MNILSKATAFAFLTMGVGIATEYTVPAEFDVIDNNSTHSITLFALDSEANVSVGNGESYYLSNEGNSVELSLQAKQTVSTDNSVLALKAGVITPALIGSGTAVSVEANSYDVIIIASKKDFTAFTVLSGEKNHEFSLNDGYCVAFSGENRVEVASEESVVVLGLNSYNGEALHLLLPNSGKQIPLSLFGVQQTSVEEEETIVFEPEVKLAPASRMMRAMAAPMFAPMSTASSTETFEQTVNSSSTPPLYTRPALGGFGNYTAANDDFGWKHTFPDFNQQGLQILRATIDIQAYDVDSEPFHGPNGEYDGVTGDGNWLNPQYLQGTNGTVSVTTFDVDPQALLDGEIDMFVDVDMVNRGWVTRLDYSKLTVEYTFSNNNAPYQPTAAIAPIGCTFTNDDLVVNVTGPAQADPDGDAVTYEYRWLVDPGTGNYIDDEFANRNDHTGNTVPAADTRDNDRWLVEVTAVDTYGARSPKGVFQFTTIGDCNTPPVANAGTYNEVAMNTTLELDGALSYDADGTIEEYFWEKYANGSWSPIGYGVTAPITFAATGVHQVRLTVTDNNASTASALAYITVVDNTVPEANAGADISVAADENCEAVFELNGSLSSDANGDPLTFTWKWQGTEVTGELAELALPIGVHEVELEVNDGRGGIDSDTVVVTVEDLTAPVAEIALLDTVKGECEVEIATAPTALDNCAGVVTGTTQSPLLYTEQGTYTVQWSFVDAFGNSSTQEQVVVVKDTTAPVPAVETLDTVRGECSAEILAAPKANDNCKGELVATTTDALVYTEQGVHVVTWTFDDGNGNVTTQEQVVEVLDVTAPVPAVETLDTVRGECSAEILGAPKATDNCKGELVATTTDALAYTEQGVHVVTWTFDDGNGNATTQTQVVEVVDVTAPVPAVETLDTVRGECGAEILTAPKANDNCKGELVGTTTDSLAFTEQGVHEVTWTYDDGNGNVTTQSQVVEVVDVTAPVPAVEILDTVRGECSAEILAAPKANDNCKGELVATTTDSLVYTEQGVHVVTWTFDDGNGNVTTQEQIVEVIDVTAPIMTNIPDDITAELATANGNTISIVLPSATDNCGGAVTVVSDAPAIFPLGTTVVTFTATDENGNVTQATMNVTVEDTTAPVIQSVTINKDTLWPPKHQMEDIAVSAVVTDISGERTITAVVSSNEADAGAFPGDIANDITPVTIEQDNGKIDFELRSERDHLGSGRTYTVTLTATDPSGNSSSYELTVFVPVESQEGTWIPYHDYKVGDLVSHDSKTWVCVYTHTSLPHWEPDAPALYFWTEVKYNAVWVTNKVFNVGDVVFHNGSMWKCNFAHTSQGPYKPGTPGIWFWNKL